MNVVLRKSECLSFHVHTLHVRMTVIALYSALYCFRVVCVNFLFKTLFVSKVVTSHLHTVNTSRRNKEVKSLGQELC